MVAEEKIGKERERMEAIMDRVKRYVSEGIKPSDAVRFTCLDLSPAMDSWDRGDILAEIIGEEETRRLVCDRRRQRFNDAFSLLETVMSCLRRYVSFPPFLPDEEDRKLAEDVQLMLDLVVEHVKLGMDMENPNPRKKENGENFVKQGFPLNIGEECM